MNALPTTPESSQYHQADTRKLALALLLDFLPHPQAHKLHAHFADEVINQLPHGQSPLFLSRRDIMSWVNSRKG